MTHPDPLALVRLVCEPGISADPALVQHLETCRSCADEVRRLTTVREALSLGETRDQPAPGCPDDDVLAALAADELEGATRSEAMVHLAACGRCRGVVASLARALADPAVAAAKVATDRGTRYRLGRLLVPAAAAAVLLIAVFGRTGEINQRSSVHRAPQATASEGPVPISPVGAGARPAWLRWGAVTGADLYRVTVFQSDGRALYQLELRDTATALPDSIGFMPGRFYLWKVEARTDWDRWTASEIVSFSIKGGRVP